MKPSVGWRNRRGPISRRSYRRLGLTPELPHPQLHQPPSLALVDLSLYRIVRPVRLIQVTTNVDAEASVAFEGAACFVEGKCAVTLLLAIFASVAT